MQSSPLFIAILYNRYLHLNVSESVLKTQLIQFREDNANIGFGSGTLAIQQSIERTNANIKWVELNKDAVSEWFKNPL